MRRQKRNSNQIQLIDALACSGNVQRTLAELAERWQVDIAGRHIVDALRIMARAARERDEGKEAR